MKENNELREVTINEWIWIIFVLLSLLNIYGDELEKISIKEKHIHDKNAKNIFLLTSSVGLIIYLYFTINSYKKLKQSREKNKNCETQEINFLGQSLVLIGAALLIYSNLKNKNQIITEIP